MLFEFMNGGFSYDPTTVVANTLAHLPWVLLFSGLAFLGGFVQMIAGLWMGFKHRTHGVRGGACQLHLLDEMARYRSIHDAQHLAHRLRFRRTESVTDRER